MPELEPNSNPLSRVELLRLAQGLGVVDADVMTRAELRSAIDKAQRPERPALDQHPVTWVSVARRLLASVVERGLNLPDAAALIRGDAKLMAPPKAPPPVATVTLARIYAAQGHLNRAVGTLDEVLESDPDHELARDLRDQLDLRRAEIAQRNGEPGQRASEGAATGLGSTPPESDESLTPLPPPVASVDAAAELVAPSFDTIERPALDGQTLDAALDAATLDGQTLDALGLEARTLEPQAGATDFPQFPSEPPTLVGVVPPELESPTVEAPAAASVASESEPPTTLAAVSAGPIENGAGSAEVSREVEATAVTAATDDAADLAARAAASAFALDGDGAQSSAEPAFAVEGDAAQTAEASLTPETDPADAALVPHAPPANDRPASEALWTAAESAEPSAPEPSAPEPSAPEPSAPETPASADAAVPLEASSLAPAAAPLEASSPAEAGAPLEPSTLAEAAPAAETVAAHPGASGVSEPPASDVHASSGLSNGVAPASAPAEPAPVAATLTRAPGLLLIETDSAIRYIYWELAATGAATPHWIHVVSHTPTGRGSTERRERCFPVHRQLGALRLEGVPRQAVVRAKLTHAPDGARPLVVAGAVRPRAFGSESFEVRYAPHAHAAPEALAGRARPLLERASSIYWDS